MRVAGTYGEDSATVAALTAAQLRGLHGAVFGDSSISTMTKHFPGCGPQRDGEDPRFVYGKEQDYPGGRMEEHLAPFIAAIAAGTRQILLSYGVPTWQGSAGSGSASTVTWLPGSCANGSASTGLSPPTGESSTT